MTYDELPDAQKARVEAFMAAARPIMGSVARVFAQLQRLEDAWAGGVADIIAALDDGEAIKDQTSLAGAQPVPKESLVTTLEDFGQAMALFNAAANRQRYIAYAGLANTL